MCENSWVLGITTDAIIARPLTRLTSKDISFVWSTKVNLAFEVLKLELVRAPVLRFPDFPKPFTLTTDASKYAVGAALSQHFDREKHLVAYASRQLNGAE